MNDADFMREALRLAEKALAGDEFPVGCVIVCGDEILARGFRKNSKGISANELDHAEMIALRQLSADQKRIDKSRVRIYCTMEPCMMCFGAILINGIHQIVYAYEDVMGGATSCDLSRLSPLYNGLPVQIMPRVLREESLNLFKSFFKNPKNDYWKDSLLAQYTVKQ